MPARGGLNDQPVNEATVEQAKRILAKNPRIGSGFLCDLLRSSGHPVNRLTRTAVVAARHAAREAAGLRPDGFVRDGFTKGAPRAADILRPAAPAAAPPAIAPVPPPAPAPAAFEVPPPVRAAAQLLAEALRDSGLAGEVTVASSGAVAFDLEVRRSFQGRLTV